MLITQMETEALSAPQILMKQFAANQPLLQTLADRLRKDPPTFAMTIARGSSDHAATFAKYLLETRLGLVTASAAPSVVTLYKTNLQLKNSLVIGLSQSGQSPDIAEIFLAARSAGAITVAFVNHSDSPLAKAAEYVVPLCAGPEIAVAATKSYMATLAAIMQFVALWKNDKMLLDAIANLPEALYAATQMDWSPAITEYQDRHNTLVIGRGYSFPIAQEAALKFKETSRIHAEAFSGAELLHGPFALVQPKFPLLMFGQHDESLPGMLDLARRVKHMGARVMLAVPKGSPTEDFHDAASIVLPLPSALHPVCDPLMIVQAFYLMMSRLAIARGFNPDTPANLSKVTMTW
jgi:glucosamine--fructose-6-phosphate aminotransferase (isomerizing)